MKLGWEDLLNKYLNVSTTNFFILKDQNYNGSI